MRPQETLTYPARPPDILRDLPQNPVGASHVIAVISHSERSSGRSTGRNQRSSSTGMIRPTTQKEIQSCAELPLQSASYKYSAVQAVPPLYISAVHVLCPCMLASLPGEMTCQLPRRSRFLSDSSFGQNPLRNFLNEVTDCHQNSWFLFGGKRHKTSIRPANTFLL